MLLVGHQHFIAGLHIYAIGDVAVRFGGVAQQCEFVAMAADERGQGIAKLIPGGVAPDGVVLRFVRVQLFRGVVSIENGAQHRCGAGTYGAIVQINLILGNQELLAKLCPVGVFILVEERVVRKRGGKILQLIE